MKTPKEYIKQYLETLIKCRKRYGHTSLYWSHYMTCISVQFPKLTDTEKSVLGPIIDEAKQQAKLWEVDEAYNCISEALKAFDEL